MENQAVRYPERLANDVARYCLQREFATVVTVSDSNTFGVIGEEINSALRNTGTRTQGIILDGRSLIADERAIVSVLIDMDAGADAMVAVGSGTITDIVRFVSHRSRTAFLSVPTAPSVDGYASGNAPLVTRGYKRSVRCHAPEVVFASTSLLAHAPREMIAAGFGDVMGKVTAVADWELAHLLIDAPFDQTIAEETRRAYRTVVSHADAIGRRDQSAVKTLFDALTSSGDAIRRFGSSEPASGSEHHISHFLEMHRLARDKPPILHGAKVAMGTVIAAGWYEYLREWDRSTIAGRQVSVPDNDGDFREIRELLGEAGELTVERNAFVSTLAQPRVEAIQARLVTKWDAIQEIARDVPAPSELERLFRAAGGSAELEALGIAHTDLMTAARLSHYTRSRFTVKTLLYVLGMPVDVSRHRLA
jgi:glycerol-1-phosphate dehydrogenase [NAD(P)+]